MTARILNSTTGPAAGTTSTRDDGDWRNRAACLSATEDLWFAGEWEREPERTWRINDAKAICDTCPVIETCLQWALAEDIAYGVFGGHTEDERRNIKRREANARRRVSPTVATRPNPTRKPPTPAAPTCGTDSGYREHLRKHERQCDDCRAWKADTRPTPAQPACGTLTGYRRHQDAHEPTCGPCKTAKAADSAQYRQGQRGTAA